MKLSENDILFISLFKDYKFELDKQTHTGWVIYNKENKTVNKNEVLGKLKQYQDAILESITKQEN